MTTDDNRDFAERRAIVTGASRGIGKAIAMDLAHSGAIVHAVSQSSGARAVANEITSRGGRAFAHIGSVADESFCRGIVETVERVGHLDIVVNAAAILGESGKLTEIPMKSFAEVLGVNLVGTCNFMHAALAGMQKRGFGRIVNFAGGGAAYSYPNFTPYAASKVAIVRVTEIVADEIEAKNVTVNVIAPGAVATDMLVEVRKRGGEVRTVVGIEEPVRLVHYLCTEDARHINGRFIHARDNYQDSSLYKSKDMLKLRRVERR